MFKRILPVTLIAGLALFIVSAAIADVPPPPANQNIGVPDGVFTGLERADCLNETAGCHIEDTINDRHHLLYNSTIPSLSVVPYPLLVTDPGGDERYNCQGCHTNAQPPVVELECLNCHGFYRGDPNDPAASPHHGTAAANDGNCQECHGDLVDNIGICSGETILVSIPCQVDGDCPTGETCVLVGSCSLTTTTSCLEDVECPTGETCDKGHYIPTYDPSLVTPRPSQGDADQNRGRCETSGNPCQLDSECDTTATPPEACIYVENTAGACNYCHDADLATPQVIYSNFDTHHGTNLVNFGARCEWCHYLGNTPPSPPGNWYDEGQPGYGAIRGCENCHGPDSLHNIQTDSNGDDIIDIGGELAGYGHVGRDQGPNDSDCWGCHGFAGIAEAAPGSGPVIPSVGGADVSRTTAGTATTVTLTGAAFTNIDGATSYVSGATLTAADGSVTTLETSNVSEGSMSAMIPAGQAPGNYDLQVVKAGSASNPAVVSVTPVAVITSETCTDDVVTINGSGFFAEGGSVTGTVVTTTVDKKGRVRTTTTTETGAVSSWSDTEITATFSACPTDVAVNTVFSSDGGGSTGSCADITNEADCTDPCVWSTGKKGRGGSCSDAGGGGGGGGGGGKPPKDK